jgi:ribosomal protein S18 acetylase RimI-like enzyme
VIRTRAREAADVGLCVGVLADVYRTSGYPTNWPADPAGWLTPAGTVGAWVAGSTEVAVAGHVVLWQLSANSAGQAVAEVSRLFVAPSARRQGVARALLEQVTHWAAANGQDLVLEVTDHLQAAQALYERTGFRRSATKPANWTTPDAQPVTLHRYTWTTHSPTLSRPS